ncbi:MAG: MFS transporter [Fidelibacterota bacterium]
MELTITTSKHNYHAFLWHAVFLALAINFMDVETIIPAMMVDAGASSFQLGMLTAIMLGGGKFAQLFFAPFLHNRSWKKPYLLTGINARILSLFAMAMLFCLSAGIGNMLIIVSIFILILLFSISGAFANINYMDIFGKSVLPENRKSFFSVKQIISSMVVFLSAFLVKRILVVYAYPFNYAILFFIAAILLGISSLGFWKIREIRIINEKITGFRAFIDVILREIRNNKRMRSYIFLTNTQGISIILMPFLVLYAKTLLSAGSQEVGNFLVLKVIGGILAGSILFYYSREIKYKFMLYTTAILGMLIPLSIILFPGHTLFPYIFLVSGILYAVHTISIGGILLEVTTNENRALYTGLSGAGSILPVIFPFFGGWVVKQFGFTKFFILFAVVIVTSFYFISGMDCRQ